MPQGLANNINQKGIDHYNALINEVVNNGLLPVVCSRFSHLCYVHFHLFEAQ
jgi:beta-glucosidase/6-phospho-beta-glucosidase/beta-galactosidase